MILYFFEQITEDDFVGPIIIAAAGEEESWALLSKRQQQPIEALRDGGWQVAQELREFPSRPAVVYPGWYRRAIR